MLGRGPVTRGTAGGTAGNSAGTAGLLETAGERHCAQQSPQQSPFLPALFPALSPSLLEIKLGFLSPVLSEAFYTDAVRPVNLLTLACALYFPAFERLRSTRSLA